MTNEAMPSRSDKHKLFRLGKAPGLPPRVASPEEVEKAMGKALKRVESWMRKEEMGKTAGCHGVNP